jgi:hypothetical protein
MKPRQLPSSTGPILASPDQITRRYNPEDSRLFIAIYLSYTCGGVKFAFHIINPNGAASAMILISRS